MKEFKMVKGHWTRNLRMVEDGNIPNTSSNDCAYCRKYADIKQTAFGEMCVGCPIYEYTGKKSCRGSPYHDIDEMTELMIEHIDEFGNAKDFHHRYELLDAIEDMLKFLDKVEKAYKP